MPQLNRNQFGLDQVEHGPEVPHALKELGYDPANVTLTRGRVRVSSLKPTHLDDIEDDEDYERTRDLVGQRGLPPVITAKHQGRTVLLDGYARTNAAYTEGRRSIARYHVRDQVM